MRFLYSLGIKIYFLTAWLLRSRNDKNKDFVLGHSKATAPKLETKTQKRIWVHISSLGEYEQVKPIIKKLKSEFEFVLTFFSPSGYNHKSVREFTNHVYYLGPDIKVTAAKNIANINPDIFILVKYDVWLNHVIELKKQQIPILLISGLFNKSQIYFKWYGTFFKNGLKRIDLLLLQNSQSKKLLESHNITNCLVCGDTRVDSVVENTKLAAKTLPDEIRDFVGSSKCLVAGSTYAADEEIIHQSEIFNNYKTIIAPHNLEPEHIKKIEKSYSNSCTKLSQYKPGKQVLIIDSIGMLKYLYNVAHIAYVGGAFGKTVHNTLEPAAYGIPIIFGPNYNKFIEAVTLVNSKGAYSVCNLDDFKSTLAFLNVDANYKMACNASKLFIEQNQNASPKAIDHIYRLIG
jgi:3-deoxy-D-manno-octulosonic-acid transferase